MMAGNINTEIKISRNIENVISSQYLESLRKGGIKSLHHLITCSSSELRTCCLSHDEVSIVRLQSARALLPGGFTRCSPCAPFTLSDVLRGALPPGSLTELYGASGAGKTQMALQAAAHHCQTGVVYVCTEDPFPSLRFQQLAAHINHHEGQQSDTTFGDKTYVLHLTEPNDLCVCVSARLPLFLHQHPEVRLIIIDSIAAPFRGLYEKCSMTRARLLKEIGFGLVYIAKKYNVAVLCINQVSASMTDGESIPCLGLSWSNLLTSRLHLRRLSNLTHLEPQHEDTQTPTQKRILTVNFSNELSNEEQCILNITQNGVLQI